MNEIKVSVIIPVYNAIETLCRCIDSVCSQTLKEIEIICVDDGSSDGSTDLLVMLSQTDNRIAVIRQENQYAGVARNRGINMARGNYVTFMDADDVYYSKKVLQNLYKKAKSENADMIKGRFRYIDYRTKKVYADDFSRNSSIGLLLRGNPDFHRCPERFVNAADVPWNGIYRRAFLLENNIEFNRLICVNDHSFYIHCLLKAKKMLFIRSQTVLYTTNRTMSLVSQKSKHFTAQLNSYNIVDALCRNESIAVRRAVMRQELIGVFSLYENMDGVLRDKYRTLLTEFLHGIEEDVIGKDFLGYFRWAEQYSMLRYGGHVNRIHRPVVKRLFDCVREHGFAYTCKFLVKKLIFFLHI